MFNIALFLSLPILYFYVYSISFFRPIIKNQYELKPIFKYHSPEISIAYVTCFEKVPFNATQFRLKTYHLSCKHRNSDECHEAVPYLQFIYDHYNDLVGKIFFIHGHEFSWHYKSSVYTQVKNRIKSQQFKNDDFGTVYPHLLHHFAPWRTNKVYNQLYLDIFHNTSMMKFYNITNTRFYCCASFFVDAKNFQIRPKYEYKLFIDRLKNYSHHHSNPAPFCGRLLEYTWHLLLAEKPFIYYNTI